MSSTEVPLSRAALQNMATQAAQQEGIDPSVFISLITHESGWNPDIVSPVGATGLGQLMPATARGLGVTSVTDPVQNLRGSARYLKQQLQAFGGNYNLALAAYNAGPAAVRKYGGIPPYTETQNYVKNVMGDAGNYKTQGSMGVNPTQPTPSIQPGGEPLTSTPGSSPGMSGQALLGNFPRVDLSMGDIGKAIKNLGGGINPAILSSIDNIPLPSLRGGEFNINAMVNPKQAQNVQDQRENFSFSYKTPGAVTPAANHAVGLAREYLGTPYVWGGESTKGFDCSGLLQYVWAKQGVNIPRTTYDQWDAGKRVPAGELRPGDAVFFHGSDARVENGRTLPGHVGMYIGDGNIIQAPHTGATVEITPLNHMSGYMGARRYG